MSRLWLGGNTLSLSRYSGEKAGGGKVREFQIGDVGRGKKGNCHIGRTNKVIYKGRFPPDNVICISSNSFQLCLLITLSKKFRLANFSL